MCFTALLLIAQEVFSLRAYQHVQRRKARRAELSCRKMEMCKSSCAVWQQLLKEYPQVPCWCEGIQCSRFLLPGVRKHKPCWAPVWIEVAGNRRSCQSPPGQLARQTLWLQRKALLLLSPEWLPQEAAGFQFLTEAKQAPGGDGSA